MKKFNELPMYKQAIRIYLLSLLLSIFSYPLFYKLYIYIFHPAMANGDLLTVFPLWFTKLFGITIFAFYFFLPLLIFSFIKNNPWKAWAIGAAFPLLIALVGGFKDVMWAVILTVVGWVLAQGILRFRKSKG